MHEEDFGCDTAERSPAQLAGLRRALASNRRTLQRSAEHYALLGGETRLKILALLERVGELCVCDLATILEMTPAAVSQHLSRLRSGRLVESRRDGMTVYYRVSKNAPWPDALPVLEPPAIERSE